MLTVRAAEDEARTIPLASRLHCFSRVRREHVVERTGAVRRQLVVLVRGVVDHLVLPPLRRVRRRKRGRELFRDVVLQPAVPGARDLPLPLALEVLIRTVRDEIEADERLPVRLHGAFALWQMLDCAVADGPESRGHCRKTEGVPSRERAAVEERVPVVATRLSRSPAS